MIPSYFVQLEKIPLTANGKVDRNALNSGGTLLRPDVEYVAPRDEVEKKIALLWNEMLHRDQVGVDENFFDLGGTSLDVIKLSTRFKEVFNLEEAALRMFRYPTISTFARYVRQKETGRQANESPGPIERSVPVEKVKKNRQDRRNKRSAGRHEQAR